MILIQNDIFKNNYKFINFILIIRDKYILSCLKLAIFCEIFIFIYSILNDIKYNFIVKLLINNI